MAAQMMHTGDSEVRVVVKHTFFEFQSDSDNEEEMQAGSWRQSRRARTAPGKCVISDESDDEVSDSISAPEDLFSCSTPTSSWCGSPTSQSIDLQYQMRQEEVSHRSNVLASIADALQSQPVVCPQFAYPVGMPGCPPSACVFWMGAAPQVSGQTLQVPLPQTAHAQEQKAKPNEDFRPAVTASHSSSGSKSRQSKHAKGEKRTTLLIRNLPNNMSREMLMDLLDAQGFAGCYDFVYLPIDFQRRAGFGYAFVNCTTPANAQRMMDHFHHFSNWSSSSSTKVCEVCWCQHSQGFNSQVQRFRNNTVMHASVPDEFKPIVLKNGVRKPFPPPTRTIDPPVAGIL